MATNVSTPELCQVQSGPFEFKIRFGASLSWPIFRFLPWHHVARSDRTTVERSEGRATKDILATGDEKGCDSTRIGTMPQKK